MSYRVRVFEYPELEAGRRRTWSSRLTPALEPKVVEDIRHVTAVEGTELTLICRLNKDVTSATLVDKEGQAIALTRDESQPHVYRARMTLTDPKRLHREAGRRRGPFQHDRAPRSLSTSRGTGRRRSR